MGSRPTTSLAEQIASSSAQVSPSPKRFFYFYTFKKYFLQKHIFGFTIYSFIPLPPDRGRQGAGRPLPPPARR